MISLMWIVLKTVRARTFVRIINCLHQQIALTNKSIYTNCTSIKAVPDLTSLLSLCINSFIRRKNSFYIILHHHE